MGVQEYKYHNNLNIVSRLRLALIIFFIVLISGVFGYSSIEGWSLFDALYMTIITISTVGFREVAPLSAAGKIFTLCLIVGGVGTGIYALGATIEFLVEGHLKGIVGEKRMKKKIESLKNHYIVCGYGRVGSQVVKEFKKTKIPFVVVENNPEAIFELDEENLLFVEGDATNDKVLELAGIAKAKGLIAAVDTDADNVFVSLSARALNPNIFIVARANFEESEEKLKKAGANRVISPAIIGGRRMAALVIKPITSDYLDIVTHGEDLKFQLEELEVKSGSSIASKTLEEANIRNKTGVLVLAIKKNGSYNTNPSTSIKINEGDILIVIGTREQLDLCQSLVCL
ncbi:potassium channel protein [Candidatus Oleimmundimicrobium sp.]|uniref:potassium channel family protein n=1 Tax=Candidatus Oleimmundimicrobium sp. TaxID=3060597 RepID=UPI0027168462|nr:potassium channel protein [Candidatus Oleimmundimicrobium sp.]MDO8885397.1 potassium channel protein [Candidatus Oleimmundimicrobium sp.]